MARGGGGKRIGQDKRRCCQDKGDRDMTREGEPVKGKVKESCRSEREAYI
jgi:hypothetical protein